MVWKPGQSGNPLGRLTEKPMRDALRLEIAAAGEDQRALRRIMRKLIKQAEEGDKTAISMIWDRLEGKPAQALIGDNEADPINIKRIITGVRRASDEGL